MDTIITQTKVCSKCKQAKPVDDKNFRKTAKGKYGVHGYCIPCQDLDSAQRYLRTREKKKLQAREWAIKHPEKSKEYKRNYARNKDVNPLLNNNNTSES